MCARGNRLAFWALLLAFSTLKLDASAARRTRNHCPPPRALAAHAGGAAARLATLTPAGHEAVIHLTLTDDHPWAQAFVVIEALPHDTKPHEAPVNLELTDQIPHPP